MTALLLIHRRQGPQLPVRVVGFRVPITAHTTVADALHHLALHPTTATGETTSPPLFDDRCSAPLCASCVMLINGWPRAACSTLLSALEQPVVLQPLPGFPVVRDLWVDRSALQDALVQVQAWVPLPSDAADVPAQRVSAATALAMQQSLTCTECGACHSVCPSVGAVYRGPMVMHALRGLALHPTVALSPTAVTAGVTGEGGISGCGNAQNCARACPQGLPVTEDLAALQRHATRALWQLGFAG